MEIRMKITPNQFAWIFVIVLVGLIGWGGYVLFQFFKQPAEHLLSVEQERKFGDMIAESSFSEQAGYKQLKDAFVDSCVNVMHSRLLDALDNSKYTYTLTVVDQPDANAFAIPGGRIYIQTGLLSFCNSAEEVAAVLAHEMGHVEHRHTVNNIVKQFGLQAVIAMIAGGSGLENISGQLLSNYFSREDESEADDFALALLEKAGIRPATLGEVFARMKHEHGDLEGSMNLLSTHPELEERSKKSSAYQVSPSFVEQPMGIDWSRIQSAVKPH
jgi:beta-barrel assembly-enhancing protease